MGIQLQSLPGRIPSRPSEQLAATQELSSSQEASMNIRKGGGIARSFAFMVLMIAIIIALSGLIVALTDVVRVYDIDAGEFLPQEEFHPAAQPREA